MFSMSKWYTLLFCELTFSQPAPAAPTSNTGFQKVFQHPTEGKKSDAFASVV